jgi:hypothetical protein
MKAFTVHSVFVLAALIFPGPAHAQMTHLGGDYYRDSSHIYVKVKTRDNSLFSGLFSGLDSYTFERVFGADPESFVALDDGYAKDKNYVYNGQRLDNMDVRTFEPIGKGFYRDKHNVRQGRLLQLRRSSPGSKPVSFDPYSFEYLGCDFVRDSSGVYNEKGQEDLFEHNKYGKDDQVIVVLDRIDIVDAKTFEVVKDGGSRLCESKDRYFLYHTTYQGDSIQKFPNRVDIVATLSDKKYQTLGCYFIATDMDIFWLDQALKGADFTTFKVLVKKSGKDCRSGFYAKDRDQVYYENRVIEEADPQTFQVLDTSSSARYAFDKNNRYSYGINIKKFSDPDDEMKNFERVYQEWKQSQQGEP